MPAPLVIRAAESGDARAIGEIYDEAAASGMATFATGPHSEEERRAWLARPARARARLVRPDRASEVVAWSAIAPFSHRAWYAGVGEYTVYVARRCHGRGIGRRMLTALAEAAPGFGYWKLVGMILPENAAGLALAHGSGFETVGTHRAHARREGALARRDDRGAAPRGGRRRERAPPGRPRPHAVHRLPPCLGRPARAGRGAGRRRGARRDLAAGAPPDLHRRAPRPPRGPVPRRRRPSPRWARPSRPSTAAAR